MGKIGIAYPVAAVGRASHRDRVKEVDGIHCRRD